MPIGGSISNFPQGFANGLSVRGMPLIQMQPGNVFWLNNSGVVGNDKAKAGSDSNNGSYNAPFATLQGALNRCVPNRGDIIFVGAGHAETISSAGALNLNTAGVAIIGLGSGTLRPKFTLDTANTATILVSTDNISVQNCQFVANFLNIAKLFDFVAASVTASLNGSELTVTAVGSGTLYAGNSIYGTGITEGTAILEQLTGTTGGVGTYRVNIAQTVASGTVTTTNKQFSVDNCQINDTSATLNFLSLFNTNAVANSCDGLAITRNSISLQTAAGAARLLALGATLGSAYIADNYYRAATTGTGAVIVGSTFNLQNFQLLRNIFVLTNAAATATAYLITTSGTGCSGMIHDNTDFCLANTTYLSSLMVTAGSGLRFGINRHSRTADRSSGAVLPAADA